MSNVSYTLTSNFSAKGLTPGDGPKSTTDVSHNFAPGAVATDDYFSNVFTVNAGTTNAVISLGKISTGKALVIEVDGDLHVTLTQDLGAGPVDNVFLVKRLLVIDSDFTAVKVTNPGGTAVLMSMDAAGTRPAVGGGPGVF
jgi:hypothetical protein